MKALCGAKKAGLAERARAVPAPFGKQSEDEVLCPFDIDS
jgi:hypothetical protein